jgi:hypothetical protein
MKKNRFLLFAVYGALFSFLVSCSSDEERKISADKAQASINSTNTELAAEMSDFGTSDGFVAMNYLSDLTEVSSPFRAIQVRTKREDARDYLHESLRSLRTLLVKSSANGRVNGDEPFNYNENKGVYTFNFETRTFDKTAQSDIIEIHFPSSEASDINETNDGVFKLTKYTEITITDEWDYTYYEPTRIQAAIYFGTTKKAELDFTAEYVAGTTDPKFIDAYYFVDPYAVEISLNDRKATSSSFSEELSKNGKLLIGVGFAVTYNSSDKFEENIKSGSAYIQLMDVRLTVSASSDAQGEDINDFVKITLKVDGAVAGRVLIVVDEITGEMTLVVKYNNGEEQSLDSLFEDLALELEELGLYL